MQVLGKQGFEFGLLGTARVRLGFDGKRKQKKKIKERVRRRRGSGERIC